MMTEIKARKIERMFDIANRVAEKGKIKGTYFSEKRSPYSGRPWMVALTEGWLAGRLYAVWIPVTREQYEQDIAGAKAAALRSWRMHAVGSLLNVSLLLGPKGKLPA